MKISNRIPTRVIAVASLLAGLSAPMMAQRNDPDEPRGNSAVHRTDDLKHPLGAKQRNLRRLALQERLQGKGQGRVHRVAGGQYVELEQQRADRVFVILAEFGNTVNPTYSGTVGPVHNLIPQPNRAVDNNTIWQADYNKAHYQDMYFTKMVDYYKSQSSGRYTINGSVVDWVKVPYNEANYGSNYCGGIVCARVWLLVRDAINIWTADQIAMGKTPAQVKAELNQFDVWDRYDYDGDGNFDEPDGYIDHFQIVHAGEGEETGGGAQGSNAIWSHRWYAFYNLAGSAGPAFNKLGGTQFGTTGMWVGDYTIQPENGGLGVFAHEFAHDLGLPDQYDTNGGDNSTGFWTIMSSGSYLGDGTVDIGSRPCDFNAWEKLQLGWLNYEVGSAGKISSHKLGPAEANTKAAQGLVVVLPDRARQSTIATPYAGSYAWWSGAGDNVDNQMTRTVTVPAAGGDLTMKLWFNIEQDWDYAYVQISNNGGASFTSLAGNVTTATNPNGQNFGNGITGTSGGWVPATFNLNAYAGQTVQLRFRYWTDGAVQGKGLLVDDIALGAFTDGAETSPNGWTLAGFKATTGVESSFTFNAYVAEFRQYRGYDTGLKTGPYNFGFGNELVEHYPYQDGLLISYWDYYYGDNNTSVHPGEGLILPIDAHPAPLMRANNVPWSGRVQAYDSTFGLEPTDAITLNRTTGGVTVPYSYPSLQPVSLFNDLNDYWSPLTPLAGVKVPKTGTTIEVINTSAQGGFMQVLVKPAQ